jgi:hypothetical protein
MHLLLASRSIIVNSKSDHISGLVLKICPAKHALNIHTSWPAKQVLTGEIKDINEGYG